MTLKIEVDLVETEADALKEALIIIGYPHNEINEAVEIFKNIRKKKSMKASLNYLKKKGYMYKLN